MKMVSAVLLFASSLWLAGPLNALPTAPNPRPVVSFSQETAPALVGGDTALYMVEIKITNAPKGSAILWDLYVKDANTGQFYAEGAAQTRIIRTEQVFIFAGPAGTYRVKCRLVKGEDVIQLVWEGQLTGNIVPVPASEEKPRPPVPVVDQLTKDLTAAYKAETDTAKASYMTWLASVYRGGANVTAKDATVKTYGELFDDMLKVSHQKVPPGVMLQVRKVIGDRLNVIIGKDKNLAIDRAKATKELNAIADALTAAATAK